MRTPENWAKRIQHQRRHDRSGEPRPGYFVVLKENLQERWVQDAIARGDQVVVMKIPWYVRLGWWFKKIFGRGKKHERGREGSPALGTENARGLPGVRPGGEEGSGEDGSDLF